MIEERRAAPTGPDEYVEFFAAGDAARGEFRCGACGYGVAIATTLPKCPMCGGTTWEHGRWRARTRLSPDERRFL